MASTPITDFIGAAFHLDSFQDLVTADRVDEIKTALGRDELVLIRGIDVTPSEQVELAGIFGLPVPFVQSKYRHAEHEEIMISSNATVGDKPIGVARVGNFWHQDSSYIAEPPEFTLLRGVTIPDGTGDTLFANACDVYDRLPEQWKERIEGRKVLHTVDKRQRIGTQHAGLSIAEFKALVRSEYPPVLHELVRVDPASGRRYLYASPEYVDSVQGFDANDNAEFLKLIGDLIEDSERVYVHRWQPGDILIWKTATTLHAATEVRPGAERTMHRVSIRNRDLWAA